MRFFPGASVISSGCGSRSFFGRSRGAAGTLSAVLFVLVSLLSIMFM